MADLDQSDSIVMMDTPPCTLTWTSTADSTTVKMRYIPRTPLHTAPPVTHPTFTPPLAAPRHTSVPRAHAARLDTIRSPKVNKSNLNFGSYASGHLASHNLTYSQVTQQVYPPNSITTHFVLLTLRHKLKFNNKPLNALQSVPQNVNEGITWIMDSCGHHLRTSPKPRDQTTA